MNGKTKLVKTFSIIAAVIFIITSVLAIVCFFSCQERHYYSSTSYYYYYGYKIPYETSRYYDYSEFIPYSLGIFLGSTLAAVGLFIKKRASMLFACAQVVMSIGAMISSFIIDEDLIGIAVVAYGALIPVMLAYFILRKKLKSPKVKSLMGKLFAVPMLINLFAVFFPTFFSEFDINLAINIFFAMATIPCYVTLAFDTVPAAPAIAQPAYAQQPVYAQQPMYAQQPVYTQQPVAQPVYAQQPVAQPVYAQQPVAQPVYAQQPVAQPVVEAQPAVEAENAEN